ncbi:small multi-drug export protein [Heliorestis convoluta]|uniref:Small multi-drug export family protein n=1 Tax=Heliorestis convoluta TaxID=356322 RepID=A0A5Q2MVT8_9FIRM|nr:small multi-drug export protein [Heliorestis convoluta]QGG46384.1 small multi-drug export family protein [Heliorestis convoluta]
MEYILLCLTAWFLGFAPTLGIYVAVPSTMLMGLDPISTIIWAGIGNFLPIPLLVYFYDQFTKVEWIKKRLEALKQHRFRKQVKEYGAYMVLVTTPFIGTWVIGVLARAFGMGKTKLFASSAISIAAYSIVFAALTKMGADFVK